MAVRVAAAQTEIRLHDPEFNLTRAAGVARHAATEGAELIVFPELFLTGPIGAATQMIDTHASWVERLQDVARKAKIDIVTGSIIEGSPDARLNRTYYVDRSGTVLGHHDKTHLWRTEQPHGHPGNSTTVVATRFGQVGLAICWDITSAQHMTGLAGAGADIVTVPAYWCRQLQGNEVKHAPAAEATHVDALCVTRAFENSIAIVFANAAGACAGSDAAQFKQLLGRSQVAVPFRGAIARSDRAGEDLVLADIDLDLLADARTLYGLPHRD